VNRALMDNASKMFSGQSARRHFVTRSLQTSKITVTEIKCDIVNNGLTAPIPHEDAFLITVQLWDCPRHDRQVLSGHLQRARPWGRGSTSKCERRGCMDRCDQHYRLSAARTQVSDSMLKRDPQPSLQGVAQACGFAGESHLVRVFKNVTGSLPEAWKQKSTA
jgi:AraC-like DNA-binding protein